MRTIKIASSAFVGVVAATLLSACGGGASPATPAASNNVQSAGRSTSALSASVTPTQELPALINKPGALGPVIPNGLAAHGPLGVAPIRYPQNDDAASVAALRPATESLNALSSGREAGLVGATTVLKHYSETKSVLAGIGITAVHRNRMVYEVTGTFTKPYSLDGFTWSSGTRIYVVDAKTGDVLHVRVLGKPVSTPIAKAG